MFLHAEDGLSPGFTDGDIIGFVRLGNDISENYYQIEIPLQESSSASLDPQSVWPVINEINLLKTFGIFAILAIFGPAARVGPVDKGWTR